MASRNPTRPDQRRVRRMAVILTRAIPPLQSPATAEWLDEQAELYSHWLVWTSALKAAEHYLRELEKP